LKDSYEYDLVRLGDIVWLYYSNEIGNRGFFQKLYGKFNMIKLDGCEGQLVESYIKVYYCME